MASPGDSEDLERRLSAAERRIEQVAVEAAAARLLAASGDRDLADLTARVLANQQATDGVGARIGLLEGRVTRLEGKVDAHTAAIKANTAAINDLSVQTGERFAGVDRRFDTVDAGFADVRARLDQTAAGLDLIVRLLTPGPDPAGS